MIKTSAPPQSNIDSTTNDASTNQILCTMLKQQLAPSLDLEVFDGNPLNFNYFLATFQEVVERKIEDPLGRLTRLIKYTSEEARDAIKHCIQLPTDKCYQTALDLLKQRFGDPHLILATYRNQIKNLTSLQYNNPKGFREFLNLVVRCESFVCDESNILDSPDTIRLLISKLPIQMADRWNRKVMILRRTKLKEPKLAEFISFIEQETVLINDPLYSGSAIIQVNPKATSKASQEKRRWNAKALATKVDTPCPICNSLHDIENCPTYTMKPVDERSQIIRENRLCYGCLQPMTIDHNSRSCKQRRTCKTCDKRHPTSLHGYRIKPKTDRQPTKPPATTTSCVVSSNGEVISMCTVLVRVRNPTTNHSVVTLAMLDSCSQATFITDSLVEKLQVHGRSTTLTVKTINGAEKRKSTVIEGLIIESESDKLQRVPIRLTKAYSRDELPVDQDEIATSDKVKKWKYLHEIAHHFVPDEQPVELLIGADCLKAIEPLEFITSQNYGPYAYRTILGWCVVGPVSESPNQPRHKVCNRIAVQDASAKGIAQHHFEVPDVVNESEIGDLLEKMYNADFVEKGGSLKISQEIFSEEEKQFMKIMDDNVKMVNGKYMLPLPFRTAPMLPNNRVIAERRLGYLKKKLLKDATFYDHYKTFMESLLNNGHASKSTRPPPRDRTWYLPHHGVYHSHKPGKVRVVLDCGAEYQGRSLNGSLLSGSDLTNQIVGVLSRFRFNQIGIMADIQSMFYQVLVPIEERSFLRFLWWDDSDLTKPIVDNEMHVHVFGATSSPSCANYALRRTSLDNSGQHTEDVLNTLLHNFYVDDMLKSKEADEESVNFIKDVKTLCSKGGFNLTKFVCNCDRVMATISNEDRGPIMKDVNLLDNNASMTDRALGVGWNLRNDSFTFNIKLKEEPKTRRGILSAVSSIYDPLGLISPFILKGRLILQQLCALKLGWDEPIPPDIYQTWITWKTALPAVNTLSIRRCFKPPNFGPVVNCTMHFFSDASNSGYGQSSYMRLVDEGGSIHVSLVMGKSRVCPTKYVSIPRLELCAAVLSTTMSSLIRRELQLDNIKQYFWTDSQVVLSYLKNRSKRFKTFVANRIEQIKSTTNVEDWHYVKSADNPADIASRGIEPNNDGRNNLWFHGPSFLWKDKHSGPASTFLMKSPKKILRSDHHQQKSTQ